MFLARGFQYIPSLDSTRGIKTIQYSIGNELLLFSLYPPHTHEFLWHFLQNTAMQHLEKCFWDTYRHMFIFYFPQNMDLTTFI